MIKARLQIEGGDILDTVKGYGLWYLDADERLEAPTKGFEFTSYAEEAGQHTDAKTVQDSFDYKVKFLVQAKNSDIENANIIIRDFNQRLYTKEADTDVRKYKQVTFYNDLNRVKIVGYPHPISEATDFWRDKHGNIADAVEIEFTITVTDPILCDFALTDVSP